MDMLCINARSIPGAANRCLDLIVEGKTYTHYYTHANGGYYMGINDPDGSPILWRPERFIPISDREESLLNENALGGFVKPNNL